MPETSLGQSKQGIHSSRSLTALGTPHDDVLAKLYNHPGISDGVLPLPSEVDAYQSPLGSQTRGLHQTSSKEANADQNIKSRSLNDLLTPELTHSNVTSTSSLANDNSLLPTRLYDPFDGTLLGFAVPTESAMRDGDERTGTGGRPNEELWTHLSRVLDLQNEIAHMHADMEGVGYGKQADGKSKGKGTLGNPPRTPGLAGLGRTRTTSTASGVGADMGDEEGVGIVEDEADKLREREFKKLATQFEGRKEAINEIMNKLDDLSKSLTEFHSLTMPKLDFQNPSRSNSSNSNELYHLPMVIPPSETTSHMSVGESSSPSATFPTVTPIPSFQPTNAKTTRTSTKPGGVPPVFSRKGHAPQLMINTIEPGRQPHAIDSPTSTISLKMPRGNVR